MEALKLFLYEISGLAGTGIGAPPMSGRIASGALIIKQRLSVTDDFLNPALRIE